MDNQEYKKYKTLIKGITVLGIGLVGGFGGAEVLSEVTGIVDSLPADYDGFREALPAIIGTTILAGARMGRNWLKNSPRGKKVAKAITLDARWGFVIPICMIPALALVGCETTPFQNTTTTTITYIDDNGNTVTETIVSTEFDQEAFAAALAAADRLTELARVLNEPEEQTPEDIARAEREYELQRAILEAIIARAQQDRAVE